MSAHNCELCEKESDIRVQAITVHRQPRLPDSHVLAYRTVSTARYVAQNTVEQQRLQALAWHGRSTSDSGHYALIHVRGDLDSWIAARVEVRDHERRARQTRALMDEQMRALVVRVISNQ